MTPIEKVRYKSQLQWIPLSLLLMIAWAVLAQSAFAQTHVAASVAVTGNHGFSNPNLGISAGTSQRKGRIGLTVEGGVEHVRKNVGGAGYQVNGRQILRLFKGKWFGQAGAVESYYNVRDFSKDSYAGLIGIGWASSKTTIEANYRHEMNANRGRIVEGRLTFYLPRHFFLRTSAAVNNFKQGAGRMTGAATRAEVGVHF